MSRRTPLLVALLLALCGCGVGMPTSGPVRESASNGSSQDTSVDINPRGPAEGDTQEQIVRGFLDAMTATPAVQTTVARQFLTSAASSTWQPRGMVVYGSYTTSRGSTEVQARLDDADHTDERGAWLGPLSEEESTITFPMEQEDGQWRISSPPASLIVPQTWFEQRFRQASLYFFDPTATILIPEPVFVPRGRQFASSLVNGLLQGPAVDLTTTEQDFLPPDLRSIVSVPVEDGVARVALTSDAGGAAMPADQQAELLVSQFAWTLQQDPTIRRFRVSIDDRPVQLAGETEFDVQHGHGYAPYVAGSTTLLFGLRDGRMVGGTPLNLAPVAGPFGQQDYGLRTVAPDLHADRVAGVTSGGTTLWLGSVRESGDAPVQLTASGEDLLDPAWDFSGRMWVVDRRRTGSVVQYWNGHALRTLDVPGISGADVKGFLVSRDGSRLVALVRESAENDRIVVSRILTTNEDRVLAALPATDVTSRTDLDGQIRDIAWATPTSVRVLHPGGRSLVQVRTASLDGASTLGDSLSITIEAQVARLIGSPAPEEVSYAFAPGVLVDLDGPQGNRTLVDGQLTSLNYAG